MRTAHPDRPTRISPPVPRIAGATTGAHKERACDLIVAITTMNDHDRLTVIAHPRYGDDQRTRSVIVCADQRCRGPTGPHRRRRTLTPLRPRTEALPRASGAPRPPKSTRSRVKRRSAGRKAVTPLERGPGGSARNRRQTHGARGRGLRAKPRAEQKMRTPEAEHGARSRTRHERRSAERVGWRAGGQQPGWRRWGRSLRLRRRGSYGTAKFGEGRPGPYPLRGVVMTTTRLVGTTAQTASPPV